MKLLSRSKAKRKARFEKTRTLLTEKVRESLVSVLPIIAIVTVLCLFLICALCDYLRHSLSIAFKIPKLIEKISSFLSHAGLRIVGFLMNKDTEKY